MKVCVLGLWHLGSVTAACLASAGHDVVGLDFDAQTISELEAGRPPVFETGLEDLINEGRQAGRLRFTTDIASAVVGARVLWVTFDTPIDDEDRADVKVVVDSVMAVLPSIENDAVVLISSQLPVGYCRHLEKQYAALNTGRTIGFACLPENLRLGKAISVFRDPDRVVVGVRSERIREVILELLDPTTKRVEWMSVESAEMTKHALNAFLAVSVTFANEIATICERVGADAKEVERGLKSDVRIGSRAYLSPGPAFAGGTLARDVTFLTQVAASSSIQAPLLASVQSSNNHHKGWARRKLQELLGTLSGKTVCVWGLTYKPGTNTLRRSSAVELCRWLLKQGASVHAFDPAVSELPEDLKSIRLVNDARGAAHGCDALVVMTEWPQLREVPLQSVVNGMRQPNILDSARFVEGNVSRAKGVKYFTVGTSTARQTQ